MVYFYIVQFLSSILRPAIITLMISKYLRREDRRQLLQQRSGIYQNQRPAGSLIWLHAASIGEMRSAFLLVDRLQHKYRVVFTTSTISSQRLLHQWLREKGTSDLTSATLSAIDIPVWSRRFLNWWSPTIMISIESEIWPNLLAVCHQRSVPVILLNARLSSHSFSRWRFVEEIFRIITSRFDAILARSFLDCARFQLIGGAKTLMVAGDLKFMAPSLDYNSTELKRMAHALLCRPVWLAASTHPGEEGNILRVHEELCLRYPCLLSVIVPRHPERGAELGRQLGAQRRSLGKASPQAGVWIADTYGELGLWYRMISIVFVGRSLVYNGGGQNMLEPARVGCAIAVGPYTSNFNDHMQILKAGEAIQEVANGEELQIFVEQMLAETYLRQKRGERAAEVAANLEKPSAELLSEIIRTSMD